MKKILLLSIAFATVLISCNNKSNQPPQFEKTLLTDPDIYNFDIEVDGASYYIQADTNSRGNYRKQFIISPGIPDVSFPAAKTISGDGWSVDSAFIANSNQVAAKRGTATISGTLLQTQYTITHALGYTPTMIFIQPKSANAAALSWVDNITSTTFRITFLSVPIIGTNNISFNWIAYKN